MAGILAPSTTYAGGGFARFLEGNSLHRLLYADVDGGQLLTKPTISHWFYSLHTYLQRDYSESVGWRIPF